ncbi:hypothetical protein JOD31_001123 [Methylopila capsulata]|uniref:Uncharacterized protein n=1 Tax=Methylopila capsulata TaxID=61654 RepID=A0A9W6ITF7_9HYPH|nr:hypothetical protein [Methylopila capsulata]MBM7850911.1 hypothetical protein [Methylopila capsulata]GLK56207.1 hypothetical protein GCM10008170_22260 [Methylopila capsulata]
MAAALLALALGVAVLAALALRRAGRAEALRRADRLDACADLLDGGVRSLDPAGDPVLRGRYGGADVALRVFAEQLAFRRLPQLWLVATVRADLATSATLDLVRRPTGAEFFSVGTALPRRCAPPAGWPQDTRLCGSADAGLLLAALSERLAAPLADPRLKSILVTPRGVRVVRQAAQGSRGAYLLFRDMRFPGGVARSDAAAALDLAHQIAAALTPATRDAHDRDPLDLRAPVDIVRAA